MTTLRSSMKVLTWLCLAFCGVRTTLWVLIAFVIPGAECFKTGLFEYALAALFVYTVLLSGIVLFSPKRAFWTPVLLFSSVAGAAASYLIWDLPPSLTRCDGSILVLPTHDR